MDMGCGEIWTSVCDTDKYGAVIYETLSMQT